MTFFNSFCVTWRNDGICLGGWWAMVAVGVIVMVWEKAKAKEKEKINK